VPTGGYAGVLNVDELPPKLEDKMETFFLVGTSMMMRSIEWTDQVPSERDSQISLSTILR
jgi:hypothetical protein